MKKTKSFIIFLMLCFSLSAFAELSVSVLSVVVDADGFPSIARPFEKREGLDVKTAQESHFTVVYASDFVEEGNLTLTDNTTEIVFGEDVEEVPLQYVTIRYTNFDYAKNEGGGTGTDTDLTGDEISVVVYPNPTSDMLYIDNVADGEVRLYSFDGKFVKSVKAKDNSALLDLTDCPTGVYVLTCGKKAFNVIKK